MPHEFVIVDVFTRTPFGGNQLAVFTDARGLSDRAMQVLAREFNFAETTFVLPPRDPVHAARVRIFSPGAEMPFAGHPTVGTAAVLAQRGVGVQGGVGTMVLEEGVGPIAVDVDVRDSVATSRFTLERGVERPAERPSVSGAAATLSLPVEAVVDTWFATAGLPFAVVRLADRGTVDRAVLDRTAWSGHFARAWSPNVFLFAGDTASGRLYARMFAPGLGVTEDPATGSAAAALAGALADADPAREGTFSWQIEQGVAMGRPSLIEASAEKRDGRTVRIRVGGGSAMVGSGTMAIPPG